MRGTDWAQFVSDPYHLVKGQLKKFFIRKSVKHRHSHDSFLFTMKEQEPYALPQLLS